MLFRFARIGKRKFVGERRERKAAGPGCNTQL
jgi:hypothetical protein